MYSVYRSTGIHASLSYWLKSCTASKPSKKNNEKYLAGSNHQNNTTKHVLKYYKIHTLI